MRAGLRAVTLRAPAYGMEGKPSGSDFTHLICSHPELGSVAVMLSEDLWVVPSSVSHLHPLRVILRRSMTCRNSPTSAAAWGQQEIQECLQQQNSV